MKKTPLAKAYELIEEGCFGDLLKRKTELLEEERQNLIDAYEKADDNCRIIANGMLSAMGKKPIFEYHPKEAEQYFTNTFEQ